MIKKGIIFIILVHLIASNDIDKEIEQILQSPPNQRRELMNRFKERIFRLNRERQIEAITHLKDKMHEFIILKQKHNKEEEKNNEHKHIKKNKYIKEQENR